MSLNNKQIHENQFKKTAHKKDRLKLKGISTLVFCVFYKLDLTNYNTVPQKKAWALLIVLQKWFHYTVPENKAWILLTVFEFLLIIAVKRESDDVRGLDADRIAVRLDGPSW